MEVIMSVQMLGIRTIITSLLLLVLAGSGEAAQSATHFTVSAPPTATAGTPFNFTVTALDQSNNIATGYSGTVHFTSSSASAQLPADTTLVNGTGTFSATLSGFGSWTITATDIATASITGTSNGISLILLGTVNVIIVGSGSGTVTSTLPDSSINCTKGSLSGCSATYPLFTQVTLLAAAADWKSSFVQWQGGQYVMGNTNPVNFPMDSLTTTVMAFFDLNLKAKLLPGDTLFASIQDAYTSVPSGSIDIQAQEWSFLEDLLFDNDTAVTLTGGMDESYNPSSGYATVKSLTVGTGSAVIGNITIK
jgi:hypothetical protein